MDTLKPNMYVRTKSKGIVKIDEVIENGVITYEDDFGREWEEQTDRKVIRYISNDGWNCGLDENDILKASNKIIDILEVGDYVNGVMVESMNNSIKPIPIPQYKNECGEYIDFDESDIKSIVTKEQFEAMEYRLGDK